MASNPSLKLARCNRDNYLDGAGLVGTSNNMLFDQHAISHPIMEDPAST
jgi:hypothetical protein